MSKSHGHDFIYALALNFTYHESFLCVLSKIAIDHAEPGYVLLHKEDTMFQCIVMVFCTATAPIISWIAISL